MKKLVSRNGVYALLLCAALGMLAFSGVRTSRAALTYVSQDYTAQVDMKEIGIALVENGTVNPNRLLGGLIPEKETLAPGRMYNEELRVKNTGTIDEFVRVTLRAYWLDENGKRATLDPALIRLNLGEGWILDGSSTTAERLILYYPAKLVPGELTTPVVTQIGTAGSMAALTTTVRTGDQHNWTQVTTFNYNGIRMALDMEADGVQTHNAADAINSAWGIKASVSDGVMSPLVPGAEIIPAGGKVTGNGGGTVVVNPTEGGGNSGVVTPANGGGTAGGTDMNG